MGDALIVQNIAVLLCGEIHGQTPLQKLAVLQQTSPTAAGPQIIVGPDLFLLVDGKVGDLIHNPHQRPDLTLPIKVTAAQNRHHHILQLHFRAKHIVNLLGQNRMPGLLPEPVCQGFLEKLLCDRIDIMINIVAEFFQRIYILSGYRHLIRLFCQSSVTQDKHMRITSSSVRIW